MRANDTHFTWNEQGRNIADTSGTGHGFIVADVVEVGRTGARFGSARNRKRWTDVEPDVEQPELGESGHHELTPEVGRTGARFGSVKARYRWQREEGDDGPVEVEHEPAPEVGRTGARFGFARRQAEAEFDDEDPEDDQGVAHTQSLPLPPKPVPPPPPSYPDDDLAWDDLGEDEEPSSLVRPYARTGGRTEASRELRLETLISVRRTDVVLVMEHRRIVEICEQTRSVAEVAAALPAPLGVARVLIDDLIELGVLTVFTGDSRPDEALLSRVLAGLRRL